MIWDNFRIALQAIQANKMRSLLTTLGIIIGVAAVIAVVSIVQGLNHVIATQFEGVGVTYIMVFPRQDLQDPDLAGREVTLTYDDGLAIMQRATALRYFNPVFYRGEETRAGSRRHNSMLLGVGSYHQEVSNHWVDRGRFFSDLDLARAARVCLVGTEIIEQLELREPVVGTDLIVGSASFTIIGVMEHQGEMFGQNQDDLVLIPVTAARDIYGIEAFKQLRLDFQAMNAESVDLAKDQIEETLRQRHRLPEGVRDDFQVLMQEELLETTGQILGTITSVVGGSFRRANSARVNSSGESTLRVRSPVSEAAGLRVSNGGVRYSSLTPIACSLSRGGGLSGSSATTALPVAPPKAAA